MNNEQIDNWLITEQDINTPALLEKWEPIFDSDRALVCSKIGFLKKIFLRPKHFVKRFYHEIYALPIEHWIITEQIKLYDDFCTIDATLDICFQATLNYALNNNVLTEINTHIKDTYQTLIVNLLNAELANLSDGTWIHKGVTDIENKIAYCIGKMLIMQAIQSRTLCTIKPIFAEFPDVQLAQKNVYLTVLKKSFEVNQEKRQEVYRQEQETEKQHYQHQKQLLEQSQQLAELDRLKQAKEALHTRLLLEDKEKQLAEQFKIEKRIHAEKIKHEHILKEMSLEAEVAAKQKQNELLHIAEEKDQESLLQHQAKLQENKLAADIANYENQQTKWLAAKAKIQALKQQ